MEGRQARGKELGRAPVSNQLGAAARPRRRGIPSAAPACSKTRGEAARGKLFKIYDED